MRIAVISDIHGNIAALEAVLADITNRSVDDIINLGDIASGALHPRETVERLQPLGLPTVRGNHERNLTTLKRYEMGESDLHAAEFLVEDHLDWLGHLPTELYLHTDILAVHGTPADDDAYLLETVTPEGLRLATLKEVLARTNQVESSVILCGHSHLSRAVSFPDGRLIVNPGSVGLPAFVSTLPYPHKVENKTPHARYALISNAKGKWDAELISLPYDWTQAGDEAFARGRYDYSAALKTGRIP